MRSRPTDYGGRAPLAASLTLGTSEVPKDAADER